MTFIYALIIGLASFTAGHICGYLASRKELEEKAEQYRLLHKHNCELVTEVVQLRGSVAQSTAPPRRSAKSIPESIKYVRSSPSAT